MVIPTPFACAYCGLAVFPDDLTTIDLIHHGELVKFHFHNRTSSDCLAKKVSELREQFQSQE